MQHRTTQNRKYEKELTKYGGQSEKISYYLISAAEEKTEGIGERQN